MSDPVYRGRFAPSPTGPLHFGSLVSAVASYADARAHHGTWLLRIDDLDQVRCVDGMARRLMATLEAFGMRWDEPPTYQSRHLDHYQDALARLLEADQAYVCDCSRKAVREIAAQGLEGPLYPDICRARHLADGPGRNIRLKTDDREIRFEDRACGSQNQCLHRDIGDFVIRRADGFHAYQLAVVVDDWLTGVTDVVRGADLLLSTPRQIRLQQLLGLPTPRYLHVPLALGADGRKLSKSDAAHPVDQRQPVQGLLAAWRFLQQLPPQGNDMLRDVDEFWEWAARQWQPAHIGTPTETHA